MKRNVIFDAMRNIDPKYIEAAAPREDRRTARAGHWKIAAIAAAVALLAVGVIAIMPFLLKNGETEITTAPGEDTAVEYVAEILSPDSEGKYRIADIPISKEGVGAACYPAHLRPWIKGSYIVEMDSEKAFDFFNISENSIDGLEIPYFYVTYDPSGKVFDVRCRFKFGKYKSVSVTIDPEMIWTYGELSPRCVAGEYTIYKSAYYAVRDIETGEPIKTSGTMIIGMHKEVGRIRILGSLGNEEIFEKVLNFLINAEFDYEALKK